MVRDPGHRRERRRPVAERLVGIVVEPVLVAEVSEAQVADPRAAQLEESANGRDSGTFRSAQPPTFTNFSSHEPAFGAPRHTRCRVRPTHARPSVGGLVAGAPAMSPPIECPTSASSLTSTGHSRQSSSSSQESRRTFSEMWRPLL